LKIDHELKQILHKIDEKRASDIGCHASIFILTDPKTLKNLTNECFMTFTNEEILMNLYSHMIIQFGVKKTDEWFKMQSKKMWEYVLED